MTRAGVVVAAEGSPVQTQFVVEDIDFDTPRDELALRVGRTVLDAIYNQTEGRR